MPCAELAFRRGKNAVVAWRAFTPPFTLAISQLLLFVFQKPSLYEARFLKTLFLLTQVRREFVNTLLHALAFYF